MLKFKLVKIRAI